MTIDYAGESRQIRKEGSSLTVTLGFALVLIYLVLAAQFKSFRDPLIVLLGSVPLAISGALAVQLPGHHDDQHLLAGGVDHAGGTDREERHPDRGVRQPAAGAGLAPSSTAIREASLTRLRPVLMTSAATVFGHFPLVLATGPGSAARNSIGLVLVTGMVVGTMFTLFVVPVFYLLMAAQHKAEPVIEEVSEEAPFAVHPDLAEV